MPRVLTCNAICKYGARTSGNELAAPQVIPTAIISEVDEALFLSLACRTLARGARVLELNDGPCGKITFGCAISAAAPATIQYATRIRD